MNYFYDLPDDLVDKIYYELHKKNIDVINTCICDIKSEFDEMSKTYWEDDEEDDDERLLWWFAFHRCNNLYKNFNAEDFNIYFIK